MRYKAQSIQDIGGIKPFLNSKKAIHNNMGYKEFTTFLESGVNITNLARAFNVSRPTAVKWLETYQAEQAVQK